MVEVQWNIELPVLLFGDDHGSMKIADSLTLQKNYPLCLRFNIETQGTCEIQLRSEDACIGSEPGDGFGSYTHAYVCEISIQDGAISSALHKVQDGSVIGTLQSVPLPNTESLNEGGISFWIVVAPGAIIIGVGDLGKNVIQGSFDEDPIPIQSVICSRGAAEASVVFSSIWVGQLMVRDHEDDQELHRKFAEYKGMFEKSYQRAQRFHVPFQPPPLHMIATTESKGLSTVRRGMAQPQESKPRNQLQQQQQQQQQKKKRQLPVESSGVTEHTMDWDLVKRLPELSDGRVDPESMDLMRAETDLHLYFLDEASGIRSKDVLRFFTDFSPRWIYWIGDRSCNVFFHDPHEAQRAWEVLTTEIPTGNLASDVAHKDEIEAELHHMRSCGWKLARRPVRKVLTDKWGKKGQRSRFIVRHTLSTDIKEKVMRTDGDDDGDEEEYQDEQQYPQPIEDGGNDDEDDFLYGTHPDPDYFQSFPHSKRVRMFSQHHQQEHDQQEAIIGISPSPTTPVGLLDIPAPDYNTEVKMEMGNL